MDVKLSEEDLWRVAVHEASHALAGLSLHDDGYKSISYMTVQPHSKALGNVLFSGDRGLMRSKRDYENMIKILLAGRAGEEILLDGDVSDGAHNDLVRVNQLIYDYIYSAGFSEDLYNVVLPRNNSNVVDNTEDVHYKKLLDSLYEDTLTLIKSQRAEVEALARILVERKSLGPSDIEELFKDKFPVKEGK